MRLLICAGRHYADSRLCRRVLDAFQRMHPVRVLIHGGNQFLGGDIEEWAREHGADIVRYPPNWQRHGKSAERLRNRFMLIDSRCGEGACPRWAAKRPPTELMTHRACRIDDCFAAERGQAPSPQRQLLQDRI